MTHRHQNPVVPNIWIVVADRCRARIFATHQFQGLPQLTEIEVLEFPKGALKFSEYVSDHSGRMPGPGGIPVSGDPEVDFEHRTAEEFAGQLVQHLEDGRNKHKFGKIILMAPPVFLGVLRQKLTPQLARMVDLELDKDLSRRSDAEIAEHVARLRP